MSALTNCDNAGLGRHLFSFVVIADTHITPVDGQSNSPFPVNRLANERFAEATRKINQLDAAFIIHLGDLVHPVPSLRGDYDTAMARFKSIAAGLRLPLHVLPGNHDVGDKPSSWGPAESMSAEGLAAWERHFPRHCFSFEHKNCRFVGLNAQIINSDLPTERQQQKWLEKELTAPGKRIFLHLHYPLFLHAANETEHYDNIAEPGRSWLLKLIKAKQVEAVFAGHAHNFWHQRHGQTDCYTLPALSFVRQDYAELFRIAPAASAGFGRNDQGKVGCALVCVYERGHACRIVRTWPGASDKTFSPPRPHPRERRPAPFGFDMRQPWCETVDIPPSGALDEFGRKIVRNDYPLMTLWEMGAARVRVFADDLRDSAARARMQDWRAQGHVFTLAMLGLPDAKTTRLLASMTDIIESVEISASMGEEDTVAALQKKINIRTFLNLTHSPQSTKYTGRIYRHFIVSGFSVNENPSALARYRPLPAGIVFRIDADESPLLAVQKGCALSATVGATASFHLKTLPTKQTLSMAAADLWLSNRIAEGILAAFMFDVPIFSDVFADVDRGHHPRRGLLDRRYNPHPAFYVAQKMLSLLNDTCPELEAIKETANARHIHFSVGSASHILWLPHDVSRLPPKIKNAHTINLFTGIYDGKNTFNRIGAPLYITEKNKK